MQFSPQSQATGINNVISSICFKNSNTITKPNTHQNLYLIICQFTV